MRKLSIFVVLLVILTLPVFSQNDDFDLSRIVFTWNVGNLSYGGNIPFNQPFAQEVSLSLVHVGIEDRYTNIGIEFNPILFYAGWNLPDNMQYKGESEGYLSLLNFKAYWNFLDIDGFFIGPFTSFNYFFFYEDILLNNFIFTAGFHIGWKIRFNNVSYNIITGELGYRNHLDNSHRYHIGVKVDVLSLFLIYLVAGAASHWWWY